MKTEDKKKETEEKQPKKVDKEVIKQKMCDKEKLLLDKKIVNK